MNAKASFSTDFLQLAAERDSLRAELDVHIHALPLALVSSEPTDALTLREWNPAAERLFGYSREEALGRSPYEILIPPDQHAFVREAIRSLLSTQGSLHGTVTNKTKDGRTIHCEWFTIVVRNPMGKTSHILSMVQDVTDRVAAEERARLWTSVLEQSTEGIMICDTEQRIVLVNAAFEKLTGYSEKEAVGRTPRILHSGRQNQAFYEEMWRSIASSGRWSGEVWNKRKNGEAYIEWLAVRAVRNAQGVVTHYVGIFTDITERKIIEARAQRLVNYDPLTELPNRTFMMCRLKQLLETTSHTQDKLAVLFIDLDRFNNINDSMGHDAGDLVLQTVARRIAACVRHTDVVCRMSADEFVVLLPALLDANDAGSISGKILTALRMPMSIQGQEIVISASIGICVYPSDGADADELIRNATAAMNRAKRSGTNAYEFYARRMNERAADTLRTEIDLRLALDRQELTLHYQPQVDIQTGEIIGAEALVRWNRPGVGLLMPNQFIPIAEERGLILLIGQWVVREAIRQVREWDKAGLPPITVAVNLSASEFHQSGFVADLGRVIRNHGVQPGRLELELTESIAVQDVAATQATLMELHRLGVKLSIDDFGTGYSSLSYLRRFPIDKIKIDKSFVQEMSDTPESIQIVRAIIGLARSFNMKVIAEGVERPEQLAALRAERCDEVQGFLASRALPPNEFLELLRHWKPWT